MIKKLLSAALVGAFALASGVALAQDAQPSPQMPATPSMDHSGGDMSKPAGDMKSGMAKSSMSKKSSMKHHMSKHHMMKHHMSKHHMMKGHMSKKKM